MANNEILNLNTDVFENSIVLNFIKFKAV